MKRYQSASNGPYTELPASEHRSGTRRLLRLHRVLANDGVGGYRCSFAPRSKCDLHHQTAILGKLTIPEYTVVPCVEITLKQGFRSTRLPTREPISAKIADTEGNHTTERREGIQIGEAELNVALLPACVQTWRPNVMRSRPMAFTAKQFAVVHQIYILTTRKNRGERLLIRARPSMC